MKLNKLHIAILLLSCAATVACNRENPYGTDPQAKSPISLTVGGVDSQNQDTKAVITDGTGKTLRAFTGQTRLFFAYVAEDGSGNKKYGFNYGTAAAVANPAVDSKSSVSFPNNYLYWDDAYARDSKVSLYSIAVANKERGNVALTPGGTIVIGTEGENAKSIIPFTTTDPGVPTFRWAIGNPQTQEIFEWADLVFSNNIANYTSVYGPDNRLKFHTEEGEMYHKFDRGELIYYHALTQFTIKIKCGDGFKGDGTDFKFTNSAGVACTTPNNSFGLNGFYGTGGVFRIGEGEFDTMTGSNIVNYSSIYKFKETHQKASAGDYYVLKAYVFPGTDMTGSKDDAFSFVIDGNRYDVSLAMLITALQNGTTDGNANVLANILKESKYLKAGYNYEFTFTVSKTKISGITAKIVDWENVTAENINPSNARISLTLEDRGTELTTGVDFYRAKDTGIDVISDTYQGYNWSTGYANGSGATYAGGKWTPTNWYWPDNTTFYHFRAVGEKKAADPVPPTVTGDAFTLTASETYKDYVWGAPFKELDTPNPSANTTKIVYSTAYGFDGTFNGTDANTHQIHYGIGPTNNQIKLLMFHMMSDVTINIQSVEGAGAVQLEIGDKKTTIHFEKISTNGSVALGNGLITAGAPVNTTEALTMSSTSNKWLYGAIPQNLDGETTATTDDVILVITTPDHNQYKVSMKGVKAETVTDNNLRNPYSKVGGSGDDKDMYIIDKWYPGFKYTYTFKLSQKKIEDIKATIVDWETVTAGDDVQIQ